MGKPISVSPYGLQAILTGLHPWSFYLPNLKHCNSPSPWIAVPLLLAETIQQKLAKWSLFDACHVIHPKHPVDIQESWSSATSRCISAGRNPPVQPPNPPKGCFFSARCAGNRNSRWNPKSGNWVEVAFVGFVLLGFGHVCHHVSSGIYQLDVNDRYLIGL